MDTDHFHHMQTCLTHTYTYIHTYTGIRLTLKLTRFRTKQQSHTSRQPSSSSYSAFSCSHTHIHTYIHKYAYAYTHTYIHTQVSDSLSSSQDFAPNSTHTHLGNQAHHHTQTQPSHASSMRGTPINSAYPTHSESQETNRRPRSATGLNTTAPNVSQRVRFNTDQHAHANKKELAHTVPSDRSKFGANSQPNRAKDSAHDLKENSAHKPSVRPRVSPFPPTSDENLHLLPERFEPKISGLIKPVPYQHHDFYHTGDGVDGDEDGCWWHDELRGKVRGSVRMRGDT
jgi:hypothetical protein